MLSGVWSTQITADAPYIASRVAGSIKQTWLPIFGPHRTGKQFVQPNQTSSVRMWE